MRRARSGSAMFVALAAGLAITGPAVSSGAAPSPRPSAVPTRSAAERAFARTVVPITANGATRNLPANAGKHVSFVCYVTHIVDAETMTAQCGRLAEPLDFYVKTKTAGLHEGERLRVLGEMMSPPVWVDVTGHPWYTAMVRAEYLDRF